MQQNVSVSLGANHGYRLEGDRAFLNAELAFDAPLSGEGWALQLWACDAPYEGGPLQGIKVAEAPVRGATERLEAHALAQLPPMQRDYAMVLVLAADGQVHDFSNYPARQVFAGPHLRGSVGYQFEGGEVVLQASVRNPRVPTNLSGTLALELWASSERYQGGPLVGSLIAQVELGTLAGEQERAELALRVPRVEPPAGTWQLALVLREWTEAGYQTRDFCSFPAPYRVEPAEAAVAEAPRLALKALSERTSISTGSVEQLAAVPGLNLKLAQAIVRARPFASLDELTRVRGLGSKMVQKLRRQLTL